MGTLEERLCALNDDQAKIFLSRLCTDGLLTIVQYRENIVTLS